jgi:hypothetical protein
MRFLEVFIDQQLGYKRPSATSHERVRPSLRFRERRRKRRLQDPTSRIVSWATFEVNFVEVEAGEQGGPWPERDQDSFVSHVDEY